MRPLELQLITKVRGFFQGSPFEMYGGEVTMAPELLRTLQPPPLLPVSYPSTSDPYSFIFLLTDSEPILGPSQATVLQRHGLTAPRELQKNEAER